VLSQLFQFPFGQPRRELAVGVKQLFGAVVLENAVDFRFLDQGQKVHVVPV
jgi:hypothetical protein